MSVEMVQLSEPVRPAEARPGGVLQQNRVFLDFFWDLAKPEQDVRLKAVESLVQYLKTGGKEDELEYTLKRLVDGLAHTREAARPGFSLALGQVLIAFQDVSLQSALDRIKQRHAIQAAKKKLARNAMFGNLFGVLALHQSGRLSKEPQVLLGCVQLLQSLSQHKQHLKDLPSKTMVDILVEVPEEVFEEVLLAALQTDLSAAFSTPEQLQLLLVALQHFPQSLTPKKLKKLVGSSTVINAENIPKLTEVLKKTAQSVKKEKILPPVVLDLLKLSLKEDSFQLFWSKAITEGLFQEPSGPTHYMSFRLLGSALPLLSLAQLKEVLSGEVMLHYGEHVVSAQKPDRFKFSPEMEAYVSSFLEGCRDSDRQLAVLVAFSSLTHQGCPVVPPVWRAVQHLQPAALRSYVDWLKSMFLQPQMDALLDFSSRRQKAKQDAAEPKDNAVARLRKWIVSRLCSIVDNHQVKKEEELVMDVARFVFFHAFFSAKKSTPEVPETSEKLSVPLDDSSTAVLVGSFFGLLMSMHHLPPADEPPEGAAGGQKRALGLTADGTLWIHHLVQYAQLLLSQPRHAQPRQPFSPEQRQAWDSVLESVSNLKKKAKKGKSAESNAFQQLFLLVGMHLFKAPEEVLDIIKDLQSCVDRALEKKAKKKKKKQDAEQQDEPEWVEVMVDILLSLLSQQSRHLRQVCKTVFSSICAHVNAAALAAILDVLDPEKDDAVVVTDDTNTAQEEEEDEEDDKEMEDEKSEESNDETDDDDDDDGDEEEEEEQEEEKMEVDQNFRLAMMKVLHQKKPLVNEEEEDDDGGGDSSDDDMDDDAMMELDKSLSALFAEQKKKNQARQEEKTKLQKERTLVRQFKTKVLDLVEVFVARQAGSPLTIDLLMPLLAVIEKGMSSNSDQQEQDFLRRAADIFRNQLCRSKVYCRTAGDRQGELHDLLDSLLTRSQRLSDSSVCLYYFSACLYVVKVLRGPPPADAKEERNAAAEHLSFMGNVDMDRVPGLFRDALTSFMSRRKSPLTTQMFTDLFARFPVLCVSLLDTAVQHITSGVREHQQGQACVLVLRAMQSREVQRLLSGPRWTQLCGAVCKQLQESLQQVGPLESKVAKDKVVKLLELCHFLVKHVRQQKLSVELEPLQEALQALTDAIAFKKTGKLEDTYWAVMKHFGVIKPKVEKTKPDAEASEDAAPKKKKGFLPESKKRKKRNKPEPAGGDPAPKDKPAAEKGQAKKKRDKKNKGKRAADGAAATQPSPAKKSKTQPEKQPAKKKKKKGKQKKEGGGQK